MRKTFKLLQYCATADWQVNAETIRRLADQGDKAEVIVAPEMGICYGDPETVLPLAERHFEDFRRFYKNLALEKKAWVLAGLPEPDGRGKYFNLVLAFAPDGTERAAYRKMHLFDVNVPELQLFSLESSLVRPGNTPVVFDLDGFKTGLVICYDLRFPELFRKLVDQGAELFLLPSAFSGGTGPLHWEPLLRARAIENGAWILAANQAGEGAPPFPRHGHTMAVDPWGKIQGSLGKDEGVLFVTVDQTPVLDFRKRIPSLNHRRL